MAKEIKQCRICGSKPCAEWGGDSEGFGLYYIQCEDEHCPEQPSVSDPNMYAAIDEWNKLYEVKIGNS